MAWFGKNEEEPVYVGTTKDLLEGLAKEKAKLEIPMPEGAAIPPNEAFDNECMSENYCQQYEPEPDHTWINLEILKLANQIEESKSARRVFYVDIGDLPKTKAEDYIKKVMENLGSETKGDFFLPRRGGNGGSTEVQVLPNAKVTLEAILETAQKLKDFINS